MKRLLRFRLVAPVCLLLMASAFAWDVSRPPADQLTTRTALRAIGWYQRTLSGHLGIRCRFRPTCSSYAVESFERYGLIKGGWRTAGRLVRCGPWTPMGTVDPP
ncbi:MAG TPA: membrane protein insertion efficiency factor YidD [Vicinamibacterales bacterium]